MEEKRKGKYKIILLTCGVLIICTAALVVSLLIAGNKEEDKIIKTDYSKSSETPGLYEPEIDTADKQDPEAANSTTAPVQTPEQAEPEVKNEQEEFVPQLIYQAETGPEHMTVDEAKDVALEYSELLFGTTLDKSMVTVIFGTSSTDNERKTWSVNNETKFIKFDAITGELVFLNDSSYEKSAEKESMPEESVIMNDETYYTRAEEIVERCLANGNEIERIYIGDIQTIYNSNSPASYFVECHIIMKTGPSYAIRFVGSSKSVMRIYSYKHS